MLGATRPTDSQSEPPRTGALTLGEQCGVGRRVVVGEVDEDRRDRGAFAAQGDELALVELGVGDREPDGGRGDCKLPAAFEHGRRGTRFPPPEEFRVGHVVVVERDGNIELAHQVEERAADREVIEDPYVVARAQAVAKAARLERLGTHVVVGVLGVDVGVEAGVAQQLSEPERVHADRVATREGRQELVDFGHESFSRSRSRDSSSSTPRFELLDAFGGGFSHRGRGPPERADLLAQVVDREEHGLAHHLLRGRDAAIPGVDRRECLHVALFLEQRDRSPDVVGGGGAERESCGLLTDAVDVLGRKIGPLGGGGSSRLDLDAHVVVGKVALRVARGPAGLRSRFER